MYLAAHICCKCWVFTEHGANIFKHTLCPTLPLFLTHWPPRNAERSEAARILRGLAARYDVDRVPDNASLARVSNSSFVASRGAYSRASPRLSGQVGEGEGEGEGGGLWEKGRTIILKGADPLGKR